MRKQVSYRCSCLQGHLGAKLKRHTLKFERPLLSAVNEHTASEREAELIRRFDAGRRAVLHDNGQDEDA